MPTVIKDVIRTCEKEEGPDGLLKAKVRTVQSNLYMKRSGFLETSEEVLKGFVGQKRKILLFGLLLSG